MENSCKGTIKGLYEQEWFPMGFFDDAIQYTQMFYIPGVAARVHGKRLAKKMLLKYNKKLVYQLFDKVGYFD